MRSRRAERFTIEKSSPRKLRRKGQDVNKTLPCVRARYARLRERERDRAKNTNAFRPMIESSAKREFLNSPLWTFAIGSTIYLSRSLDNGGAPYRRRSFHLRNAYRSIRGIYRNTTYLFLRIDLASACQDER